MSYKLAGVVWNEDGTMANKELSPLEALKRIRQETCPATYNQDFDKEECCDIIEKSLKALEIIRETPIFAWYITNYKNAYEMVCDVKGFRINNSVEELQEMFDLLKEVLL